MGFIGKVPTPVPLTSADITDGIISVSKLTSTLDLSSNTVTLPSGVGGKVLQVVQGTKTDTSTISSGFADIGLSAAITPSASSSKILITCQITCTSVASDNNPISTYLRLLRGSTAISQADSASSRTLVTTEVGGAYYPDDQTNATITFLDSPSTTSATTYKIQASDRDLGSGTLYIGRGLNDQDIPQRGRGTSNIV